jgi:hypothetical protein
MTKQGKRGPVKSEGPLYDVRINFLGSVSWLRGNNKETSGVDLLEIS